MKKVIWFFFVIVLLALAFLYMLKNPQWSVSQNVFSRLHMNTSSQNTGTQSTGLVFVNDPRFEKITIGGLEALRDEPGGLASIEKCKANPQDFGGLTGMCEQMQKILDSFVLGDYIFVYSGFTVTVVDMSTVSGHKEVLASGLAQFTDFGNYPEILANKILTNTIWLNRSRTPVVVDLTGVTFPNADQVRTYISFEGQDGLFPVITMIFQKENYLVKITSNDWFYKDNNAYLSGEIRQELKKAILDLNQFTIDNETNGEKILNYYTNTTAKDQGYQTFINFTIQNMISRFAIK